MSTSSKISTEDQNSLLYKAKKILVHFTFSVPDGLMTALILWWHTNRSIPLHWRHNDHGGVLNHQPHDCLLNRLFRRRWKKTSKLRVTGLCAGNSPGLVKSPHKGPVTRKMVPFDHLMTSSWQQEMTGRSRFMNNTLKHIFSITSTSTPSNTLQH